MSEIPERGEQVEARIARRLEQVFAWKVIGRRDWWGYDPDWGWYDPTEATAFTRFKDGLRNAGVRFADRSIVTAGAVIDMSKALAILVDCVEQTGRAKDGGAAIAKAATLLRYMQPRYILMTDEPSESSIAAPSAEAMDADLAGAERRMAVRWAEEDRKRRAELWRESHAPVPPGAVRTWQDDDWREQE